ncbi:hypothetical protein [Janibacter sp. G1551]|uniref:hypothetical protein n=1 Tax=Janibacter sp. G1551 TaxID=3420440 RepID=UPI003D04FC3B
MRRALIPLRPALAVLLVGSLGSVALAGCSAMDPDTSYRPYESVSQVAEGSDVVVQGEVSALLGTEFDGGGNDEAAEDADGVTMAFYEIEVEEELAGQAPDPLVVAWPQERLEGSTPPAVGDDLVLGLHLLTGGDAPGIDSYDTFAIPVGGDSGTFLVRGDRVEPRGGGSIVLTPGDARRSTATLADVRAAVRTGATPSSSADSSS